MFTGPFHPWSRGCPRTLEPTIAARRIRRMTPGQLVLRGTEINAWRERRLQSAAPGSKVVVVHGLAGARLTEQGQEQISRIRPAGHIYEDPFKKCFLRFLQVGRAENRRREPGRRRGLTGPKSGRSTANFMKTADKGSVMGIGMISTMCRNSSGGVPPCCPIVRTRRRYWSGIQDLLPRNGLGLWISIERGTGCVHYHSA